MTGSRILVLVSLAAALATGACGRKPFELEAPGTAANDAKRNGGIGINRPAEPAPPPVEDRRFILDGLI